MSEKRKLAIIVRSGTLDRLAHEVLNRREGYNLVVKEEVMMC
jgi:hypothetical protein